MALAFRNIDASPDDPVRTWPFDGVLIALERGGVDEWRRLAAAIQDDRGARSRGTSSRPWRSPTRTGSRR